MTPDHRRRLKTIEADLPGPSEISVIADLMEFLDPDELDQVAAALERYRFPNGSFDGVNIPMAPGNDLVDLLTLAWERRAAVGLSP